MGRWISTDAILKAPNENFRKNFPKPVDRCNYREIGSTA